MENKKTQNNNNLSKKIKKNMQKNKNLQSKQRYFDYYDDIKEGSGKVIDW